MKGKYIYYTLIDTKKPTGIQKKILAQLKVFNSGNNQCELYYVNGNKGSKYRFFLQQLPIIGKKYSKWKREPFIETLDYLYIRRPSVFDFAFINYLKDVKKSNPKIKIVVEIPTFPYDEEYMGFVGNILKIIDKLCRQKMKGLIDAFAIVAWHRNQNILWGIPVLPIYNGIDLDSVKKIQTYTSNTKNINLLCIAYFSPWHGYEKFIEALSKYYRSKPSQNIILHMVGGGPEIKKYKEIVKKQSLEDKVIFHGEINENLDEIYERIDIGVCSINSRNFGVLLSSQLKSREYLAKGLPVITCGDIDILQKHDFPYELIVDYDRIIEYDRVVEFFNNKIAKDTIKVRKEIREFAEKNCGWNSTMKNVLDYLNILEKEP